MDKILLKKIKELFAYRAFEDLYKFSGIDKKEAKKLDDLLINLQAKIYHLDTYLETNWNIKTTELNKYWKDIYQALSDLGIPKASQKEYVAHILKYQKHELDLRKDLLPLRLDTEYYYFYKSCDVKLMRRILFEKLPKVKTLYSSADWRYFDLVTEVNDDATDLKEDLSTINGNMILIAYETLGRDATLDYFINFLDNIGKASTSRFSKTSSEFKINIHSRTLEQIEITKTILKNSKVLNQQDVCTLFIHLKNLRA